LAVTAGLAAIVLVAAGCSSSKSSSSSTPTTSGSSSATGSSSAPKFTGSPIKIGTITTVGTAADLSDYLAASKGAVRAINARGGINGHEVVLDYCNEALDPNKGRACARQMVSDHVMATVANASITAEADVNKILADAGIANVGAISYSGASGTDPNSYLIFGTSDYSNVAMAASAVSQGYKRVAQLVVDLPAAANYIPLISKVVAASGGTYAGSAKVPQTAADLSTQAAALNNLKPDVVILNTSPAASLQIMRGMSALGYKGKFISKGSQFFQSDLTALGPIANQLLFVSPFPAVSDTSVKGIAEFRADMAAEKAAGDSSAPTQDELVRNSAIDSWLAVIAVERIADQAKATDAASFKKAINAATNVGLDGVIAPWTPNKAAPAGAAAPRMTVTLYYLYSWTNGKSAVVSKTPIDVENLVNQYLPR
jgi:ABC-type branched-subunit amino acid transport system substrate-binding protein